MAKIRTVASYILVLALFSILCCQTDAEDSFLKSVATVNVLYNEKEYEFIDKLSVGGKCTAAKENNNSYITPELRLAVCRKAAEDGIVRHVEMDVECYDDRQILTKVNPCAVTCPEVRAVKCEKFNVAIVYLLVNTPCGPNHHCSSDGCCMEDIVKETPTTPTPEPTTRQTTIEPSTTPSTVISPNPESEELIQEFLKYGKSLLKNLHEIALHNFSKERFTCRKEGKFLPRSRSNDSQRYIDCHWVATVHQCSKGQKFSSNHHKCVKDPSHKDPEMNEKEWSHLLKCHKEGVFRSPFDCQYYYYCTSRNELSTGPRFNVVGIKKCQHDLVFDPVHERCEHRDQTVCENIKLHEHHNSHSTHIWNSHTK